MWKNKVWLNGFYASNGNDEMLYSRDSNELLVTKKYNVWFSSYNKVVFW